MPFDLFTYRCQGLGSPPPKKPLVQRGWWGLGALCEARGGESKGLHQKFPLLAPLSRLYPSLLLVHSPSKTFFTGRWLISAPLTCKGETRYADAAEMVARGPSGPRPTRREGSIIPLRVALWFPPVPSTPVPTALCP